LLAMSEDELPSEGEKDSEEADQKKEVDKQIENESEFEKLSENEDERSQSTSPQSAIPNQLHRPAPFVTILLRCESR
jgi:hypothetical protein